MSFAHPWLLLLLLAVPVIAWLKGRRGQQAAFLYSSVQLVKGIIGFNRSAAGFILPKLRWLALILLLIGLARPQRYEGETQIRATGIDIVVAVDLSKSMAAEDFEVNGQRVNRLEIAKAVLEDFIDRRPGDRIGLVAFAGRAYIASPMTLDHAFLLQNLERLNMNSIEDGTAIGSGLSASLNRLRELDSKSKIVILMTDGQNNSGKIPPLTAAEAAESIGIKVYTIGVGTRGMAPMPYTDVFGQRRYQMVQVNIDEETLKAIADRTGGQYYRADNTETLLKIYDEIDQLEKTEIEVKKYVQYAELFPWFVLPGLGLLLLEILLAHTIWRRLP
ncbi:MAG TPA: hypothetical protein DCY13_07505 [Verrucomicrobiales bacterium]|nr:hypothetical protein [Verrucomicrobiales bacterium]